MDFFETVEKRRSIRAFQDKGVDAKTIKKMLDAVNLAPSAGDLQAYRVSVVRNEKTKEGLMLACMGQEFVAEAPAVLVFSADKRQSEAKYGERGHELYAVQDATIAAAYCQLAATALGLGSVWVGGFDPLEVSRIINAGPEEVPVAVIPVGYPAEMPGRAGRKQLKELVRE
jgi:nitroreductase